jgi:hypothetical protein
MFVGLITLLSALSISAVAIYYSVIGLTAIFSAAATAIIVMGVTLELGKLVTVVWLHQNWKTANRLIKSYLVVALVVLMLITSMGIFGFLSKAHMDQSVPTGDVADKVALIDEKIKTQRDNIEAARNALKQMDAQVDARLTRSDDEKGAERAIQIRRVQAKERASLQNDIAKAQTEIAKLNEERAPVAKDLRKVEAEVGPIKYIANFFYDDTDQNVLEKAVTWVILILIFVFDPLAIVLLIAAQISLHGRLGFNFKHKERNYELVQAAPPPQGTGQEESTAQQSSVGTVDQRSGGDRHQDTTVAESDSADKANEKIAEIEQEVDIDAALASVEEIKKEEEKSTLNEWNAMIAEAERAAEAEKQLQDEAAQEALKWAKEQEEKIEEEAKKKELTWFEKDGPTQIKKSRPE